MESRTLDFGHWRTRALVQGSGDRNFVFLHSLGANAEIWVPVLDLLGGSGRCIALDIRGQGHSATGRGATTIETLADDVIACLNRLGTTRCTLVGVSVGGMLAQRLAAVQPNLVARLVLADTACDISEVGRDGWLQRAASAEANGMAPLVEPTLDRWFPEACHVSPGVRASVGAMVSATDPKHYAAAARAIATMDLRTEASQIRCPTIVVVGEHDAALPVEHSRVIESLVPHSSLTILEGVGHCPPLEAPEALAALIDPARGS